MRDFKNYNIWKLSHQFVLEIYQITKSYPSEERFNLISQLRRAAISIPTNIAEGAGKRTDPDFRRYLDISLGSSLEVEYLLILSKDLQYIDDQLFDKLNVNINDIKKKIFTLIQKI